MTPTPVTARWAALLPPRPLPRTAVPIAGETTEHYLRRLAAANHQGPDELLGHLCAPNRASLHNLDRDRLAAAAGQPTERIARLHQLTRNERMRHHLPEVRPACRRCTARRGLLTEVPCMTADHVNVCRRHQLWIGPGATSHARQYDLRGMPEILDAQRHHHRLLRDHDAEDIAIARERADGIWRYRVASVYNHWTADQQRRITHLDPDTWPRVAEPRSMLGPELHHSSVITVAIYPEVVHLAGLLLRLPATNTRPTGR